LRRRFAVGLVCGTVLPLYIVLLFLVVVSLPCGGATACRYYRCRCYCSSLCGDCVLLVTCSVHCCRCYRCRFVLVYPLYAHYVTYVPALLSEHAVLVPRRTLRSLFWNVCAGSLPFTRTRDVCLFLLPTGTLRRFSRCSTLPAVMHSTLPLMVRYGHPSITVRCVDCRCVAVVRCRCVVLPLPAVTLRVADLRSGRSLPILPRYVVCTLRWSVPVLRCCCTCRSCRCHVTCLTFAVVDCSPVFVRCCLTVRLLPGHCVAMRCCGICACGLLR
jgi:hypothetical protein